MVVAGRKPRPAGVMLTLIEGRFGVTDVEKFSSTVMNRWTF